MRIAIIGAGISGLSFYLFLRKLGLTDKHHITIYEAREAVDRSTAAKHNAETYNASVIGASIGLSVNGLKVLKRLDEDLLDEVMRTGHVITTCKISTARGWILANVPVGPNDEEMLMIGREDFWRCLKKRTPGSLIARKKLANIEIADSTSTSMLLLSDSSNVEADLVVGADGIWSVVRRTIFDGGEGSGEYKYSPNFEGLVGVGGFVSSSSLVDAPNGEMDVIFGANGFFGYAYTNSTASSPAEHGDKAVWWSTYSLKDCPADWRHTDLDDARTQLQGRHGTWKNKTVQRILSDVEITSVYPTFTTPLLPTWERNGCVLIGDAAHALQPSSGQGGSMALEDCEALALLLHYDLQQDAEKGHMIATKQYSELRMPRLGMVHKKAQETGAMKQDMGLVQEMVMYFFIWLMNHVALTSLLAHFSLRDTYNRTLYDYDGPSEVRRKVEESEKSA